MLKKSDYFYDLPEELIAQTPVYPRDSSRLLHYDIASGKIKNKIFRDILNVFQKGDLLVINDTKVLPARMFSYTQNGGKVEILLLKRQSLTEWEVMVKPGKKAKEGALLTINEELSLTVKSRTESGGRIVEFHFNGVFEDIISRVGEMPLPPYIKEKLEDQGRYQTVYAKNLGSSAAPTAGLHFTPELISALKGKGVEFATVELKVGLGTFRPVKEEDLTNHVMHTEWYEITKDNADIINKAKLEGRRVIAVGTTSVRTLETVADENGLVKAQSGDTSIFIYPPYKFKCVNGLITNFHLPESTLIMLVSAFLSREKVMEIYNYAVSEGYRFFSFGDACLLL
ncbi:MAG: tRNA preQ1(34) S-adenosylmethionine ribosyltransferase-isomerase QueA [Clostridia bacterium]|nr:tRNA preQ1(34) S-adenosylmethionine ribosyltransferase-isomerase QueA [Clostridia bacterium]